MKKLPVIVAFAFLLMTCGKSPTGPGGPDDGGNKPGPSFTITYPTLFSDAGFVFCWPEKDAYSAGDTVMLEAYPFTGYSFAGWSGDFTASSESLTIVMTKDITVYANFLDKTTGKKLFSIATIGPVELTPDGGVYDSGTIVTARAVCDTGMIFSGWSGLVTGTDSAASFTVVQNGTLKANFTLDPAVTFATIRISPLPVHGKIMMDPPGIKWGDGYKFKKGVKVTLSTEPDGDYEFDAWGGDFAPLNSHLASMITTLNADITITATFKAPPPASTWTRRTSGNGNGLLGVAFNGSLIVVVGNMGTILTSTDAAAWTSRTSGATACLNCVIWTGSMFVCVGDGGTILTSRDGITWEKKNSPTAYGLQSVVWTGSKYVAVGGEFVNSGLNHSNAVTSTDATTWTTGEAGFGIWYAVAWTGSMFVATGYDYSYTTMSDNSSSTLNVSPDGASWTFVNSNLNGRRSINALAWARNMLVGVGGSRRTDDPFSSIFTSSGGTDWTEVDAGTESSLKGIAWTGSYYVAVGNDGVILTSSTGSVWNEQSSGTTDDFYGVGWAGTRCVAVGYGGMIMTSP